MFTFKATSLDFLPEPERITRILNAALGAVEPAAAIERTFSRSGCILRIAGSDYDIDDYGRLRLIAFGKAAVPMAEALSGILSGDLDEGLVIGLQPGASLPGNLHYMSSAHPVPDERSLAAGEAVIHFLRESSPDDFLLCAISGGGSAMLAAPVAGVSLTDLQATTSLLLAIGASIDEINTIRKHLDRLKGGGLLQQAKGAQTTSLIVSDVVGDRLDVIASGPTVPDSSTYTDAWKILEKYTLIDRIPSRVREHLWKGSRGEVPGTLKPGAAVLAKSSNQIIASNRLAANAVLEQAEVEGFNTLLLTTWLQGEAGQAGRFLGAVARQMALSGQPLPRPACLIVGGETTVTLQGSGMTTGTEAGGALRENTDGALRESTDGAPRISTGGAPSANAGGRNQEMALAAVKDLAGLDNTYLVTLATDGRDGPTDAAGAVASGETLARARQLNLDIQETLARHDSYHFFEQLGDLLHPGLTGTNVNDLALIFTL